MAVSTWTPAQYRTLCDNIAKGVTSVDLGNGEKVTFRSLDEMTAIKRQMEVQLGLGANRGGISVPTFSRGARR